MTDYDALSKYRISELENAVAKGLRNREKLVDMFLDRIRADIAAIGGDLYADLHFYGTLREKWKENLDFTEYDKKFIDIVTHPERNL